MLQNYAHTPGHSLAIGNQQTNLVYLPNVVIYVSIKFHSQERM